MAGNYADVPGPRIPYDIDGSVGFKIQAGVISKLTAGQLATLNNEASDSYQTQSGNASVHLGILFPELRDLVGYVIGGNTGDNRVRDLQVSSNTTNGQDGTWTTVAATPVNIGSALQPTLRTSITAINRPGVKAVRFIQEDYSGASGAAGFIYTLHLYGAITAGEAPDKLRIWHPTLDQEVGGAYFDWADVQEGSSHTKQFRVKNSSGVYQANNVTLSTSVPTNSTPSLANQITYDMGGGPAASLNIGTLAPGQISSVITAALAVDPVAALGLWVARTLISVS